jgi:hypothetical protein
VFKLNKIVRENMRKKGQIAGQVFIYMMAVIIIGGIALIGYSAVKKIVTKSCDAEKASFKTDIIGLIEKYTSYGSVNKKTLKAPCEYETVCFVDTSDINSRTLFLDPSKCDNPLIRNSVKAGNMQNIFVISNAATIPIGYSDLISLDSTYKGRGCLCITQTNRNFYITFNGLGSSTEISRS